MNDFDRYSVLSNDTMLQTSAIVNIAGSLNTSTTPVADVADRCRQMGITTQPISSCAFT